MRKNAIYIGKSIHEKITCLFFCLINISICRCLADLSRLIPSQYMRKGRGRVEKTEIIEMAIRHLKNLQTQEVLREATYAEHYRSGYNECISESAKFLLRERDEELYYKMITHLRDHMAEAMKGKVFSKFISIE